MMKIRIKIKKSINNVYYPSSKVRNQLDPSVTFGADSSCETIGKQTKSCLKKVSSQYIKALQKTVRFLCQNEYYEIIPLFQYKSELWWTNDDLLLCQKNQFSLEDASQEVQDDVASYIDAYMTSYDKVFQKTDDRTYNNKISGRLFKIIADGRSKGYGGLEVYHEQRKRYSDNRYKVLLTIESYHYFIQTEKKVNASDHVRDYSRSLTAADRYWARVIGNADTCTCTSTTSNNTDDM